MSFQKIHNTIVNIQDNEEYKKRQEIEKKAKMIDAYLEAGGDMDNPIYKKMEKNYFKLCGEIKLTK